MKQVILVLLLALGIITTAHAHPLFPVQSFKNIHAKLDLNTAQEAEWKSLLANMDQFRILERKDHKIVYHALQKELKKSQPDFDRVITLKNSTLRKLYPAREQLEQKAIEFYDELNPHQKTLIRDAIRNCMAKWGHHHGQLIR